MKTLSRTRIITIVAIGLASIAAIVVFANLLWPKDVKKLPVQLTMQGVLWPKNNLQAALDATTLSDGVKLDVYKKNFKLSYDDIDVGGGAYSKYHGKTSNNVTQHVALENSAELKTFIDAAFKLPTATPCP